MPRLNIEDRWFSDPRRAELIAKIGEALTDGSAVKIWKVAQDYYRIKKLVPENIFQKLISSDLFLKFGLAKKLEEGVYVCGSNELFAWLAIRVQAGKSGGIAKASKSKQRLASPSPSPSPSKGETKEEEGAIDQLNFDIGITNRLKNVSKAAQITWLKLYDVSWVRNELLKAVAWLEVNPKKKPKMFGRFMGGWLSRGWEKHRKTLPSNRPPISNADPRSDPREELVQTKPGEVGGPKKSANVNLDDINNLLGGSDYDRI